MTTMTMMDNDNDDDDDCDNDDTCQWYNKIIIIITIEN